MQEIESPTEPRRLNPLDAITPLYFGTSRYVTKRNAKLGLPRALDKMAGSCDFLLAFRDAYPTVWAQFLVGIGITDEKLITLISLNGNTQEPECSRKPKDDSRKYMRYRLMKYMESMDSPWSEHPHNIRRECANEAKKTKRLISEVRWLELLLNGECEAREVLLQVTDPESLTRVLAKLEPSPDMPDLFGTMINNVVQGTADFGHKVDGADKFALMKNVNPGRIPKPEGELVIPEPIPDPVLELTPEEIEFDRQLEEWMNHAEKKAREFRAPRILFDHLFLCLLEDGTDTSRFLDSRGIKRESWREGISTVLPVYETETDYLRPSNEFGDVIPEDYEKLGLVEAMERLQAQGLSQKESMDRVFEFIEETQQPRKFIDLLWLEDEPLSSNSVARSLLRQANIGESDIKTEIRRVLGITI